MTVRELIEKKKAENPQFAKEYDKALASLAKEIQEVKKMDKDTSRQVYLILEKGEVVGVFKQEEYAEDFVEYQKTISDTEFLVEEMPLADWLSQPKGF